MSVLDQVLVVTRHRRYASRQGGFGVPFINEQGVDGSWSPFLVTNMKGRLVQTKRRPDGTIWSGYTACTTGQEPNLLLSLFRDLCLVSKESGWDNRCVSLNEAIPTMSRQGFEPKSMLVPYSTVHETWGLSLEESNRLMVSKGHVATMGEVRVLTAPLPDKTGILVTVPDLLGTYTRADDYLSLTLQQADKTIVLVNTRVEQ